MLGSAEIELPRLRQGLYRFFAVAFLPPESARVKQLAAAAHLLDDLGVDTLAFAPPWLEMRRLLDNGVEMQELATRYVRLFESGSDGALCPPVESFYVSSPREGGPALVAAELESAFTSLGLSIASESNLQPDHISAQLELMALMCAQEASAAEQGDLSSVSEWSHEQQQFSDSHLNRWIPYFVSRVQETTSSGFYRALVVSVGAFVDHDRELLHVLERRERTGPRS
jgi:TorA maturation chaperone TorD